MAATPKRKKAAKKTYAQSGVDIDAGDALVDFLKRKNPAIGGFSGLAELPKGMKNPRLVMSTDGVGTKLLVAHLAGLHKTIGIDLVAMVVNDLLVCGARPLWFLDYFATGKLEQGVAREVLAGIQKGCKESGCALIGGETAEMPGMYGPGHYDLAGFGVGAVDAAKSIDGSKVKFGDVIIGLASSGLHSNGYSLARAALLPTSDTAARTALRKPFTKGSKTTLAQAMLTPTKLYVQPVLKLMSEFQIGAMAHITGGGIAGNLVRSLPKGVRAFIDTSLWTPPRIFWEIMERGPVDREEMFKVFNMGIGFTLIVRSDVASKVLLRLKKMKVSARAIGWVDRAKGPKAEPEVLLLGGD